MGKIYTFSKTMEVRRSVSEVFDFFTDIRSICLAVPDYVKIDIVAAQENFRQGDKIKLRVRIAGINFYWQVVIEEFQENAFFFDRMISGPFRIWEHKHYFSPLESGGVSVTDDIKYELPLGIVGRLANKFFVEPLLVTVFINRYKELI